MMSDASFVRFISCLRNHGGLPGVTTLMLDAGDGKKADSNSISPDSLKRALPEMPGLTGLSLSGKKFSAAVLTHLADAKKFPTAANLSSLKLDTHFLTRPGMLSLLKSTSRLEHLALTHQVGGDGSVLPLLSHALRAARGGGVPLLTELVITGDAFSDDRLVWNDVVQLGMLFPELQECRLHAVCNHKHRGQGHPAQTIADCLQAGRQFKLSNLPRLRILRIGRLAGFTSGHLSTEELEAIFSAINTACPVLQVLDLRHGSMGAGTFPAATARCFQHLPATLTSITLADVVLRSNAFATTAVPELNKVHFHRCGPNAAAVAAALVDTCPRLSEGGVTLIPRA